HTHTHTAHAHTHTHTHRHTRTHTQQSSCVLYWVQSGCRQLILGFNCSLLISRTHTHTHTHTHTRRSSSSRGSSSSSSRLNRIPTGGRSQFTEHSEECCLI